MQDRELFAKENENRDYLLQAIEGDVEKKIEEKYSSFGMMIGKEVPIPYRHIYIPGSERGLEIWCFKQDICVYRKLFDKTVGRKDAVISANQETLLNIVLNRSNTKQAIGLPYVIIETKMAKNINTHDLLTYTEKVRMIKTIFPYCVFFLLCFGELPSAGVFRHRGEFDEVFCIKKFDEQKCNYIIEKIYAGIEKSCYDMIDRA
jgi:hypothetical protein